MYSCLGNDVVVESITEIDGVDIVTALDIYCQWGNNLMNSAWGTRTARKAESANEMLTERLTILNHCTLW